MKKYAIVLITFFIASCSKSLSGNYGGSTCPFTKVEFNGNTAAFIYLDDVGSKPRETYRLTKEYKIHGDQLTVINYGFDGDLILTLKENSFVFPSTGTNPPKAPNNECKKI